MIRPTPLQAPAARVALAALTLILSACSDLAAIDVQDIARIAATPAGVGPRAAPTAAPADVSTAALVKMRSKVVIGLRYDAPPLSRVNADGELEGMDVDLARDFARRWLGSERNAEFVQVTSLTAPEKLRNREIDLAMGGLIHTQGAEAIADFSQAYVADGEALLTRTGAFSDFASLAGRSVTYIDAPSIVALGDAQLANNITVTLRGQNTYRAAVDDLLNGATDAVAGRWRRLRATATNDPALSVPIVLTNEPVAIMLPPDDSAWADLVNQTLSAQIADGTFDQAYRKWFGAPPDPIAAIPQPAPPQLADLPDAISLQRTLETVRNARAVRVGFNPAAPPFSALDANGLPDGFEVDLAREMARRWFGDAGAAQFSGIAPGDVAAALSSGAIDLAVGGIAVTGPAEQGVDFSQTTFVSGGAPIALALPQNASPFRDLVNFTLQEMQADGTFGTLFQKWFPDQPVHVIERWPGAGPTLATLLAPPTPAP